MSQAHFTGDGFIRKRRPRGRPFKRVNREYRAYQVRDFPTWLNDRLRTIAKNRGLRKDDLIIRILTQWVHRAANPHAR